jgi:hypothetical protein
VNNVVWLRGHTALLQVSRQVHEECADLMYGSNAFEIDIKYDSIKFRYAWVVPSSGLRPKALYYFPEYFSQRNIQRIRNYVINIEHVDSYTGRIKYNVGGAGLTAGVRNQVRKFVNEVRDAESLGRVFVRLSEGNKVLSEIRKPGLRVHCVERGTNSAMAQTVLSPFQYMKGVRLAEISGSVTPEYAAEIERAMTGRGAAAATKSTYPLTIDTPQDPAVLWRWRNSWNA